MKVVIVGTGNVAHVFGRKILGAGHQVIQVIGQNIEKVTKLASVLNAGFSNNVKSLNRLADIYIIAVSDSSITKIAANLKMNDKIVVHTAAAVSKDVLSVCSSNYGVLYPLQSLRKEVQIIQPIPVLIDSNNAETTEILSHFAKGWAESVEIADDAKRKQVHIAAVFVNNFTNHLFSVTERYCKLEGLNFNLLYPLIEETIIRIKEHSPSAVQTGPAIRKDFDTISTHEKLLQGYPELQTLYGVLTDSIINFY